MLHAVEG